jgi:hypothetical protein
MIATRVYLWRSELAQRLYRTIGDPAEQALFVRMLSIHELTEAGLRVMSQQWIAGRLRRESLIEFLANIGWLVPDARENALDPKRGDLPLLSRTALEIMRRESVVRQGFWSQSLAVLKHLIGGLERPRSVGPMSALGSSSTRHSGGVCRSGASRE